VFVKQIPTGLKGGFTLIEMLVVMVLIGLLLSLVLPRFGGVGETERLRTAMRLLAAQAMEAHSQAVTEARPWFFCLDLDRTRSWLAVKRPEPGEKTGPEVRSIHLPSGLKFRDVIHPAGGMFRDGVVAFAFWPNGGNEPGTIHVKNDAGEEMTLFLRPYLGQSEIHQGYLREEVE